MEVARIDHRESVCLRLQDVLHTQRSSHQVQVPLVGLRLRRCLAAPRLDLQKLFFAKDAGAGIVSAVTTTDV